MARNNQRRRAKGSAGSNKNNGAEFITKYQQKADVHCLPSGLMYRVIEQVEGPTPTEFDTVTVNQRILLADGAVIADTYKESLPDKYSLQEAIPGLREGLQLMPLGSRYEFVIPPELAWGRKGNGSGIGPYAVMVVDARLLKFE